MDRRTVVPLVWCLAALTACTASPAPTSRPPQSRPPATGGTTGWQALPPAPSARTEVAAAAAGSRIVVVGGYRADGASLPTTEILDTGSDRWQLGPDLPVGVNHAMAASVDGIVHVFGGHLADRTVGTGTYRLDGDAWRPLAPLPQGRSAGTAVAVAGRIYVVGGVSPAGLATDMLVYDVAADRWSTAPGPPTPREHLGGAGFGGLVYAVGGRTRGPDTNVSAFEVFDPRTGAWRTLPDLPSARGGLAAAATCDGRVVAVGGEATATFGEVEAFDVRTGRWTALPPIPTPRHGLGVVALANTVYAVSGGPRPGLQVSGVAEALAAGGPCR